MQQGIGIGDIVTKTRELQAVGEGSAISQRELARRLSALIEPHDTVSYGAVHNWEMGLAVPPYWFLVGIYQNVPGWPRNMALEMLARLRPDLWGNGRPVIVEADPADLIGVVVND